MKRFALLTIVTMLAVGFWSSIASATLYIYDPFNYSAGQLQTDTLPNDRSTYGTAGGDPTTTPAIPAQHWGRAGVASPPTGINVTGGSLTGPSVLPPSVGNELAITNVGTADGASNRMPLGSTLSGIPLAVTPVSVTANTFVYYSFLLNVGDLNHLNNTTGAFFFSFNNTTTNNEQTGNPGVQPGKVQIRIDPTDATKYNLGIFGVEAQTSNASSWASNQLSPNSTIFVVGAANPNQTHKEFRLWINPDPLTFGQDTAPSFTVTDTDQSTWSGNNIGSVLVRQNGLLPNLLAMDELRVGNSWASVTPTLSAYWDINTDAGAGGNGTATPSGTWDGSIHNWNLNSDGTVATQAWPGATYNAVFSAGTDATGAYTVTVSGTQSALSLTFKNGSPTLSGGTVNVTSGVIKLDVTTSNITATIGSVLNGNAGLNLIRVDSNSPASANVAALVLAGSAVYTGSTTVGSGVNLTVGDGTTNGALPAASVITNNGTLAFSRSDSVTQGTHFDSASAGISGSGNLVQAGNGNLVLTAANTYTGTTQATAGTLTIKHALAVQNSVLITDGLGSIVFDPTLGGANVQVGGLSSTGKIYTAPSNMNLTIRDVTANATYAGAITGTGTLTKSGSFAQTLSGANNFSGATTINVGTLQYANKGAMSANSAITVNGRPDWTVPNPNPDAATTTFTGGVLSVYVDDGTSGTVWSNSGTSAPGTLRGLMDGKGGQGSINWKDGSSLGIHIEPNLFSDPNDPNAGIVYSGAIGSFATPVLAGDFNSDRSVDARDYVLGRKAGADLTGWRQNFGATVGITTDNVGIMKRGYGTLTLSGANTYSGQLKVNDEGGTLRLTTVQTNAGQSMALPAVYIGGATQGTPTILKVLTDNALPVNSLIRFGSGSSGVADLSNKAILRLQEDEDPISFTVNPSFNQTIRGLSGGNGVVEIGGGTLTINTPAGESYSYSGRYMTGYDGLNPGDNHGTIIKTGEGRQDFNFFDSVNRIRGMFILQQGTVGIGNAQDFGQNNSVVDGSHNPLPWPQLTINGGAIVNTSGGNLSFGVPRVFIGGSFSFDTGGNNSQFNGGGNHTLTTLTASPTITVTPAVASDGTGTFILPYKIEEDGTPRGITKAGAGTLSLGSEQNSYRGDTVIQEGAIRLSTGGGTTGAVPTLGKQTVDIPNNIIPGRLVLAGGRVEMTSNVGTIYAPEFSGNPYADGTHRANIENNPVHVEAPNNNSTIAFFAAPGSALTADNAHLVFTSNSVDWTSGKLTFAHISTANASAITFKPTFTGAFSYQGPVTITNNTNGGKTVLVSANDTGTTQTWANVIDGNGSFDKAVDLMTGGAGTTILSALNGYLGSTTVEAGILSITNPFLANANDVIISGGTLNLNFSGSDTIRSLKVNGTWAAPGTYGASDFPGFISGTGTLTITTQGSGASLASVPEPASIMLSLLGVALLRILRRRLAPTGNNRITSTR